VYTQPLPRYIIFQTIISWTNLLSPNLNNTVYTRRTFNAFILELTQSYLDRTWPKHKLCTQD
jgi:hypothetical protein